MHRIFTIAICATAIIIFGGVIFITETAHLSGISLFALWIGAFVVTTIIVTILQIWQMQIIKAKQQETSKKHD